MLFKKLVSFAAALGGVLLASSARAQIGGADLPDLSGLAGAIERSVKTAPTPPPGSLYQTGLAVPSVHPGSGATAFARSLRVAMEQKGGPNPAMQKLEAGMPAALSGFESYLTTRGFQKRDLGVALGIFFVENWQTSTKQTLSDFAEASAVRSVAALAAVKYKAKFAGLLPESKERTYETLISSTLLLSQFATAFDKAGKPSDAAAMRQAAGALFTKVVGQPPSSVRISANGRISGPAATGKTPASVRATFLAGTPTIGPGRGVSQGQIAGIYCQPAYGGGVGGGVSVSYEPVLALKDGTYLAGYEVPPSDLNVAVSRRAHPGDWGRWKRQGSEIQTFSNKGQWEKSGWIGPLPPSGPGQTLSGRYTKISGGGNSALGGDITVAIQDTFVFTPKGRFQSGSTNSITSSQVGGGASRSGSGIYAISRDTITLRFADGRVQRWSYAKTADGLLFLHGKAYVDDK